MTSKSRFWGCSTRQQEMSAVWGRELRGRGLRSIHGSTQGSTLDEDLRCQVLAIKLFTRLSFLYCRTALVVTHVGGTSMQSTKI